MDIEDFMTVLDNMERRDKIIAILKTAEEAIDYIDDTLCVPEWEYDEEQDESYPVYDDYATERFHKNLMTLMRYIQDLKDELKEKQNGDKNR